MSKRAMAGKPRVIASLGVISGFLPPLAFLFAALLVYGNTLGSSFVWEDKLLISENTLLRDPRNLGWIVRSGFWTTQNESVPQFYRPLTIATLALNYHLGGGKPFGFHLANLVFHAWVSWLVYRLALGLSASPPIAWSAGLIFLIHPVHTECVGEVQDRSELLSAGFLISALLLDRFAQQRPKRRLASILGAALCYLAAMLSKESAIVLPAALLVTDLAFPVSGSRPIVRWRRVAEYGSYLLVTVVYLIARVSVLGGITKNLSVPIDNPLVATDSRTGFLTAIITTGKYVCLLFWPRHLSVDYSTGEIPLASGLDDLRVWGSILIIGAAVALLIWSWNRSRLTAWSVLFYAVTIALGSNLFIKITAYFGERLLYLPSTGFCIAMGVAFAAMHRRWSRTALGFLGVVLLLGSIKTVTRNQIWQDDAVFYPAMAADAPGSYKAQHNLGAYREKQGDLRGAETAYRAAASILPHQANAHLLLAGVLSRLGKVEESIAEYERAVSIRPNGLVFRIRLGELLYTAGRYAEAAVHFRAATRIDPANALWHDDLARAYEANGEFEMALPEYRAALKAKPDEAFILRDLGLFLARRGEREEAIVLLRRADSLTPGGLDPASRKTLEGLEHGGGTRSIHSLS